MIKNGGLHQLYCIIYMRLGSSNEWNCYCRKSELIVLRDSRSDMHPAMKAHQGLF